MSGFEEPQDVVGPKTARCPVKRNFLGPQKPAKIKTNKSIRTTQKSSRSLLAQGPLGGLHDRPLKDLISKREGFPHYLTRQGPEARRISVVDWARPARVTTEVTRGKKTTFFQGKSTPSLNQ